MTPSKTHKAGAGTMPHAAPTSPSVSHVAPHGTRSKHAAWMPLEAGKERAGRDAAQHPAADNAAIH